jgi:hypothetical protein
VDKPETQAREFVEALSLREMRKARPNRERTNLFVVQPEIRIIGKGAFVVKDYANDSRYFLNHAKPPEWVQAAGCLCGRECTCWLHDNGCLCNNCLDFGDREVLRKSREEKQRSIRFTPHRRWGSEPMLMIWLMITRVFGK